MAVNVGTAEIAVVPDLKNFGKQASTGLTSATAGLKKAAGVLGIGLGAAFAVNFGKEIIEAANAAEQSNRRLQAAAEDTSIDTQKLIDDFAELGLATAQDDEMLKDLAATLIRMGFKGSTEELEAEVTAITDLGAATSKGTNIITRFFVALNTGNVGKAISSAKTLGLVTQQQADHFKEMADAGREAEVVQKILTIAQTRAHGAAAKQATDLDILTNKFEEFKEDLGTQLVAALNELMPTLERLADDVLPVLVEQFGDLGGVVVSAADTTQRWLDMLPDWLVGTDKASESVKGLAKDVQGLTTDNGLLGGAFTLMTFGLADFTGVTDHSAEITAKWAEQLVHGSITMDALNRALNEGGYANQGLAEQTKQTAYAMGRADMAAGLEGDAVSDLASAHNIAAQAAKGQKLAEEALAGGLLGLRADAVAVMDSQRTLNELRKSGKKDTREYRDAEADLLTNQLTLKADLREYNAALKEQGLTTKDVRERTEKMGESLGLTKEEIEKLFDPIDKYTEKLNDIPENVTTTVTTKMIQDADPSMQAPWPGGWDNDPKTPYPMAMGGIVRSPTIALLGEAGPEAVVPLGGRNAVRIYGEMTIKDWRHGIAELDGELAWGDSYR